MRSHGPPPDKFARKHVEEGSKAGLEEGREEGEQKMLLEQLGQKFGELPEPVMQRLRVATDADLERWAERVLTARTLDDVFAD